jgi:hypothetical protein
VNDDELVGRLRRALHTEADMLTPGHGTPRVTPVSARARHRRGLRNGGYALVAAAAVVAAVLVITLNGGGPHTSVTVGGATNTTSSTPATRSPRAATGPSKAHRRSPRRGTRSPTTKPAPKVSTTTATTTVPSTATASTTVPPATTVVKAPAVVSVAADFVPLSATFVTADDGWVLGVQVCAPSLPCLKLDVTTDRGASWQAEPGPAITGLTMPGAGKGGTRPDLQIRFATPQIGWIFNTADHAPALYWTDNGGASWTPDALPARFGAGRIEDLETADDRVEVAFLTAHAGVGVATSSVGFAAPSWTESGAPIAGPATSAQLVIQGNAGWLVAVNGDNVVGGARIVGSSWQSWTSPCRGSSGPALLAASTPSDVIAVCGRSGHQALDVSSDGGNTFPRRLSLGSLKVTSVTSGEASSALVGTSTGTVASVSIPGDALTTPNPPAAAAGQSVVQIGFEDGAQGLLITGTTSGGRLYLTSSAGQTWEPIDLAA